MCPFYCLSQSAVNALTAAGMGVGGLPNGNLNTNLAAELLAAELQQMTIQNILTAHLNAAAAAVAVGIPYGNTTGSSAQTLAPSLPMGVSADPLQALQALHQFSSPSSRQLGLQGIPPGPVSWP